MPHDLPTLVDRPLTVASVPANHVYVRHLDPPSGLASVRRLPDPDPDDPRRSAQERWWPPVMLQPSWAQRAEFDVFHVHFGFDACDPTELERLTAVLTERRKRFVLTVHDLRNPHHEERSLHDAQLAVLTRAADRVVTLTPGAAAEIRAKFGVESLVLPHPHVVDFATMERLQRERAARSRDEFRVGLHVKSLRPSMDPMRLLPTLLDAVRALPAGVLQVNGHRDVLDGDGVRRSGPLARWLADRAAAGEIDLRVHDFLPDDALWAYLADLDVSVLPYRFGTHSGWLEACRDLGTRVIAPTCGHYAEQGPVLSYVHDEARFDAETLVDAVAQAYAEWADGLTFASSVADRRRQRQSIADAHDELYAAAFSTAGA